MLVRSPWKGNKPKEKKKENYNVNFLFRFDECKYTSIRKCHRMEGEKHVQVLIGTVT